ncbi:MAG: 5-oxoprolinase subunit PxpA, partial [Xanthomonadaceae bacterium]|nr:5-oxoprolinase subunit PxpA [Xanthomonadaceae bacterium]
MAGIDLNCDLGESFGAWTMGEDEAVLPHVSSANVACGFHAGDPTVMRRTVALAKAAGVAIGAHVSLPDLQGFGRREMKVSPEECHDFVLYQVGALAAIARAQGVGLSHVKPHGALYNMAARDAALATAIAHAVRDADRALVLYGLSGSALVAAGEAAGLRVAHEVFADRGYRADGALAPRGTPGAVIDDPALAAERAAAFAAGAPVAALDGTPLRLR